MAKNIVIFFVCCGFFFTAIPIISAQTAVDYSDFTQWQNIRGDHFIVYYTQNGVSAKEVLHKAETCYSKVASDLGYARYSNFWQWENRVNITIYPTKQEYTKETGEPEWTEGIAIYNEKKIVTYEWSQHFLESLLPHEITHLIFRDFVGFKGQIPLWLDEGIAQWEEPKKREVSKLYAREVLNKLQMFPFVQLTAINSLADKDVETVNAFYMQSLSAVDFLIATYGTLSFADFCRELRDGKSLNDALKSSYSGRIRDLDHLEALWIAYVKTD